MVGLEILLRIREDKRVEFLQAFEMLRNVGKLADIRFNLELYEQLKETNTFLWLEHWTEDKYLADYFLDNKFRAVLGAIDLMGEIVQRDTFFVKNEGAKA